MGVWVAPEHAPEEGRACGEDNISLMIFLNVDLCISTHNTKHNIQCSFNKDVKIH